MAIAENFDKQHSEFQRQVEISFSNLHQMIETQKKTFEALDTQMNYMKTTQDKSLEILAGLQTSVLSIMKNQLQAT